VRPPQLAVSILETRATSLCAKVTFLYDAFMGLPWPLNLIFKFAVTLWQLLGHLVRTARGIAIEEARLQGNGLAELEFVHAFGALHHRLTVSASADRRAFP
jgi:hypothetical protein